MDRATAESLRRRPIVGSRARIGFVIPRAQHNGGEVHGKPCRESSLSSRRRMVLPHRIELWTSPLPRGCSTTELRQRERPERARRGYAIGGRAVQPLPPAETARLRQLAASLGAALPFASTTLEE